LQDFLQRRAIDRRGPGARQILLIHFHTFPESFDAQGEAARRAEMSKGQLTDEQIVVVKEPV
jgi:hypothetical protein